RTISNLNLMIVSFLRRILLADKRYHLSPQKLLILQFIWILPYVLVTNYLERSLLAFRLACYTQSDLLSNTPYANDRDKCIDKLFMGQRSEKEICTLKDDIDLLITPRLPSHSFDTVIVVRSAPKASDYRNYIRRTWAKDAKGYAPVIFVVAKGANLTKEAEIHGDIMQLNYPDSYYSLSKKMTGTYRWFLSLPSSINKLVVVNDDVVLHVKNLQEMDLPPLYDTWVVGKVSRGYPRLIFPWITWYVSGDSYPQMCYPRFIQGSSMVFSRSAVKEIFDGVCSIPLLPLDDVWMGVQSLCLPFEQVHREGFDVHWQNEYFVVFHHQYERYDWKKLETLYNATAGKAR
ncbi:hypothetical protein PFISCL1PPCAC_23891, partial [Pristionchus fissidentatus]